MKAKFGAIVVAGSGKIGGHVMSRNRGGAYMRTKGIATNPNTSFQQVARALLASLASGWSQLTESQRLGWNDAVASYASTDIFGDIKNPSGFNLYVKLNANLSNSAQTLLTDVPVKEEVAFGLLTAALFDLESDSIIFQGDVPAYATAKCIVYATPTLSAGTTFVKNRLRIIGVFTGLASALPMASAYVAKFGTPAVGGNISIGVQPVTAGGLKGVIQTLKMEVAE